MLLRFRTANHRCFRDPVELSLVSARARGVIPAGGDWIGATTRVAGIYGANASGKSTVLHALEFLCSAVARSATSWGDRDKFVHVPFALSHKHRSQNSTYEIDILVDGVRYTYGFESNVNGISSEWLYSYPVGKRRLLFERIGEHEPRFVFGRTLQGENITMSKLVRPTALFLSVAANNNHPVLGRIHHRVANHIRYAQFDESDQDLRLKFVQKLIEDKELQRQTEALLRFADLGILRVELSEREIDDEFRSTVERILVAARVGNTIDDVIGDLRKEIRFRHQSDDPGESISFSLADESSGTKAWLSLAVPALDSLKYGGTFLVDEIDSSLHPRLTAALIGIFKDPRINKSGAQLIFTSHDTSLMGPLLGKVLASDEIWFTEKGTDGSAELSALEEFKFRDSDNFERRYLHGRYGAVPMVELDVLRSLLTETPTAQ